MVLTNKICTESYSVTFIFVLRIVDEGAEKFPREHNYASQEFVIQSKALAYLLFHLHGQCNRFA